MLVVVAGEPVGAPFPDIADSVEQAQTVGGEVPGRAGADEPVVEGVRAREFALPDIAVPLPVDEQPVAPRIATAFEAAAGRELPLGLARQPSAGPLAIGAGIVPADVDDGMVSSVVDSRSGPFGCRPVRAGDFDPPGHARGLPEHMSACSRIGLQEHGEHRRGTQSLCRCDESGVGDEPGEIVVRHACRRDVEFGEVDPVTWSLPIGGMTVAERISHIEGAADGDEIEAELKVRLGTHGTTNCKIHLLAVPRLGTVGRWSAA